MSYYVPKVLPEYGDCAKLGMVDNSFVTPLNMVALDPQNYPTAFRYNTTTPTERMEPPPDGYLISIGFPQHSVSVWTCVAAFRLYDIVQGEKVASDKMLGWYYKVTDFSETDTDQRHYISYTIEMKLAKFTRPDSGPVVPGNPEDIGVSVSVSGQKEMKAFSNVVGFDDSYIGFVLQRGVYNDKPIFAIYANVLQWFYITDNRWVRNGASMGNIGLAITEDKIGDQYIDPVIKTDPNQEGGPDGGPSGPGGGNGTHDRTDDHVGIPPLPSISATAAGFVTLYNPSLQQINAIADEMIQDSIWEALKNFVTKFSDYVVGLGIIPVQPTVGSNVYPRVSYGLHYSTALPLIINQFVEVNCGEILIDHYYDSAFDQSGETGIQIFLPYIGYRDLNVDDIMGKMLGVVYHVDVYSGNLICYVTADGELYYQFSGNCLQQVPTAAESYDSMIEGGIMFATAAVAAISTGGAAATAAEKAAEVGTKAAAREASKAQAAATASEHAAIGSGMQAVMHEKPQITRSGSMGASSGLLGCQIPYIIKTIPNQSLAADFMEICGYPSNITGVLSSFSGYVVVDSVNLQGIGGTDDEIAEILAYLKGGVIV